jgi:hypothetical protein
MLRGFEPRSWRGGKTVSIVAALAPGADIQPLVEFLVQLLLLGIEIRRLFLLGLFCGGTGSKRVCPRLQMIDRAPPAAVVAVFND